VRLESLDERAVRSEDHVRLDKASERGCQVEQGDLAAGQSCDMVDEDDAR
jgi:hypothetical protein